MHDRTQGISRRHVLTIAAGASVTSATAVIGSSTPAQAAKVPQKMVKYQDTPKGKQRCEYCVQFEAPSTYKPSIELLLRKDGARSVRRNSRKI